MAEVVCKTNVFSPCNRTNYHQQKLYRPTKVSFRSNSTCFYGRRVVVAPSNPAYVVSTRRKASSVQMSIGIAKAQRWWEKGTKPNMRQVEGAQDLVDSLHNAGDKLVVVDFYSPGCGGCKALHPKLCQLAEMNPDVQFLQVNYEEHKSMCYSLNVHVLPFFRFYRGAHGRLCSFSCTNATIKKFKDALAKHSPDRCSLGEPKGLEEKELAALTANKDLSFTHTPKPEQPALEEQIFTQPALVSQTIQYPPLPRPRPLQMNSKSTQDKTLVSS